MSSKPGESSSEAQTQAELLRELRDKVFPWVRSKGIDSLVLAQLPLRLPPGVKAWRHPMEPLPPARTGRAVEHLALWPKQGMKAVREPFVGFVLEGEADFRIAIARKSAGRTVAGTETCTVVTLRPGDFLLFPPGAPHDDRRSHWFRPHPERAFCRILWIQPLPSGVFCHICVTQGTLHPAIPVLFVRELHIGPLLDLLTEEMSERLPGYETAGQGLLLTLLTRLERALTTLPAYQTYGAKSQFFAPDTAAEASDAGSLAVARARRFIDMHLGHRLSVALIARHVFISSSNLNGLFRAYLAMAVMRYVAHRRMETAKSLLAETELAIGIIAATVGYPDLPHFSRSFRAWNGMSPLQYRNRRRQPAE